MFSKACQYAIRATLYIGSHTDEGGNVSLKDIATEIDSPEAFTAKILQKLVHHDIIHSIKGPHGGFSMTPGQLNKVKLSQIVFAIDGDAIYKGCGLGLPQCSEKDPCPVHNKFKSIRQELRNMLEKTSISQLTPGLLEGLTVLKR